MARTFADPVLAEQGRAASLPPAPPCPVLRSRVASTDHIYMIVTASARGGAFQPRRATPRAGTDPTRSLGRGLAEHKKKTQKMV